MPTSNYLSVPKYVFLMFIMSLLLIACNKNSDDQNATKVEVVVPTLSDENIKDFTIKMAKDYLANLDSLVAEFNAAKEAGDEQQFINFRNYTWTPNYIKQKNYYQKVLENNASYLALSPSRPLFDIFESLIYIGISLKNSLLDKDDVKLQEQLATIANDKNIVNNIIK